MHAHRDKASVHLSLGSFESKVLRQILMLIRNEYLKKPSELDREIAAAWYNAHGATHMSAEEQADWLQQMHELKSARVELMDKWIKALEPGAPELPVELTLPLAAAPDFLTVINDHRLLTAARNEIGQAEMDVRTMAEFSSLPPIQQTALAEIHFLAVIMENLLYLLASEPPADSASGENIS
jgi:hypothetical protein